MNEQWLSIVEYARTFKVSDMTIRRRIKTGKLEAVLQDGKYFIPINEIERSIPPSPQNSKIVQNKSLAQPAKSSEMTLIKGHLGPNRGIPESSYQQGVMPTRPPQNQAVTSRIVGPSLHQDRDYARSHLPVHDHRSDDVLPQNLTRSLSIQESSLVDTRALLAYCEATLRKANDLERKTIDRFKSKLEAVEATLACRDQEIKSLRQQLEDMQLLVKIMERRKSV